MLNSSDIQSYFITWLKADSVGGTNPSLVSNDNIKPLSKYNSWIE